MALTNISNVTIRGIAACVPSHVEENLDIPVFNPGEAERVIAQTGIERKHVVDEGVCVSDLCVKAGEKLLGKPIDYVFLGACTNGRIEDFRAFASIAKGRKKADSVVAWLVPGSWVVRKQIEEEGLDKVLADAGFEIRQPGCSACLAMNDDKIPAGKYAVSTSNRNFEGRQGPGSRTILASPLVAAACAVTGVITDPRELL